MCCLSCVFSLSASLSALCRFFLYDCRPKQSIFISPGAGTPQVYIICLSAYETLVKACLLKPNFYLWFVMTSLILTMQPSLTVNFVFFLFICFSSMYLVYYFLVSLSFIKYVLLHVFHMLFFCADKNSSNGCQRF